MLIFLKIAIHIVHPLHGLFSCLSSRSQVDYPRIHAGTTPTSRHLHAPPLPLPPPLLLQHAAGGSGKTTLADLVFNQLGSCFKHAARITLDLEGSSSGQLQGRLKDLLGQLGQHHSYEDSKQLLLSLAELMKQEKVLLLLDNVNHTAQLDGLLPNSLVVSSGSRVIITSREPDLHNSQTYAVSAGC